MNFEQELSRVRELFGEGSWSQARVMAERALAVFPDRAPLWFLFGASLHALGERRGALNAFRKTTELAPAFVPALNAMATVLTEEGLPAQAIDLLDRAVALAPSDAPTLFNRGIVLERLARLQESLAAYDAAIVAEESFVPAWLNRGAVLMLLGRYGHAVDNNRRLSVFQPDSADAHFNLAEALLGLGRSQEALAACARAIELDPRYAKAYIDRGLARADLGRFDEAQRAFEIVEGIEPGAVRAYLDRIAPADPALGRSIDPRLFFLYRGHHRLMYCDWSMRDLYIEQLEELAMDGGETEIARIDLPLAYHSLTVPLPPQVPHRIASVIGDRYAARIINSDCIDVLVDFGGYTEYCRPGIAAFRPACVQLAHIGFPGTMAAPWIDYRITDRIATPPAQELFWREKLVFMPDSFFVYDGEQDTPAEPVTRAEYGLPEGAFVFCCHNNSYKIEPEIFSVWMSLLSALPDSVLWLAARNPAVEPNLLSEARARGVNPARLVFAHPESRQRYFSRYRLADLFLDTPQFNAATTACDALWMGLPLLSISRDHFTSRQASSILSALGLSDLVVESLRDYRALALRLATEPETLQSVKKRLARAREDAPMFRTKNYVRNYERALDTMVRRQREGKSPVNLHFLSDGNIGEE